MLPYADRGLISRQQWNGIIQGTASHLWLYGTAEFGYAIDDDVPVMVSEAVAAGCEMRILLLVMPHLRFTVGSNSPTFELTEASARKMFGRYVRHVDHMWNLAKDWT